MLTSKPTADVTVPAVSLNVAEGTVSPASLIFTDVDWNVPQTVTVTGVADFVVDGTQPYTVSIGPAAGGDATYRAIPPTDLAFTNTDIDAPGLTIGTPSARSTSESGTSLTFTVVLNLAPAADVTVPVTSTNPAEGAVSPAVLVFTVLDWNLPQTVTVTGVPDAVVDGPQPFAIRLGATTSADPLYDALAPLDLPFTNADVPP